MRLTAGLLVALWAMPGVGLATDDGASDARRLARSGKYAEAAEMLVSAAKDDPAAAVALAGCLVARGRRAEAARVLAACRKPDAALWAAMTRLALARGDHAEARRRVEEALRADPEQLLARWLRGELARRAGRLDEAQGDFAWLVNFYNDHDVPDAASLRWIAVAAAQHARWNRLHDQFPFLVNDLLPEALAREPDYWPAALEAGLLYLEKFNEAEASRCLQEALRLNPNAAEVHAALARLHLVGRDVAAAEAAVRRAIEINAESVAAWQLRAELHWDNFAPDRAADVLAEKALPLDPTDEETLGALAACYVVLDRATLDVAQPPSAVPHAGAAVPRAGAGARLTKLLDEVNARNPRAGAFYFTAGQWLAARHKARQAEWFLREATARMPRLVGPRAELALLYMKMAREDEARKLFEEAGRIDPFNLRVANMLELFEVLDGMKTIETQRAILRYDAGRNDRWARWAVEYLDATMGELCARFGYTPETKPVIEAFGQARGAPGRAWFGTRMTGLPYVGTVAASSGRMVAMVSPGEGPPLNWARVMRHELVHVVTLQQTDFDVPHWFTEALAVHAEDSPRPQRWNEILQRRAAAGKLFTLDTINFGFTRPNSGDDWHLAYCQAELYLDYMFARHGPESPKKLLAAYAEGLSTSEAIRQALGVSQEEFERGFKEYVAEVVKGLSGLARVDSGRSFEDLLAEHRRRPDDADAAAELAYHYVRRGAFDEAAELVRGVVGARPDHPLAAYVEARLLMEKGKPDEAAELLARRLDREHPQAETLSLLAALRWKSEDYAAAAELYRLAHRLEPGNPAWLRGLVRTCLATENNAELADALARLAEREPENLPCRKKLVEMALERRDFDAAVRWARECVEIDAANAETHALLARAVAAQEESPRKDD
ncbi:MAG: tetratricopeptide repeat protein [Pirellulales bacterium]|nr:tetratricopeptide repeat protein [Pirellulales bacterium]